MRLGNDLQASKVGLNAPNTILLLNSPVQKTGVLYAFSAYFSGETKVGGLIE